MVEFANYVNEMSDGLFVSSLNKKFADRIRFLIAHYQTGMDIRDGLK
jgi:hypothetical protein